MIYEVLMVSYLIIALMLIGFVLIQQGKGADMGASFGAGGSNTVFGSSGSGNFMTRTTAILATCFFVISLLLGSMSANQEKQVDEFENLQVPVTATEAVPSAPIEAASTEEKEVPAQEQTPN